MTFVISSALYAADPIPLPRAHAHNDYLHKRPLQEALENGFGSVEADIWLVDGKLLVAHDRERVSPERTLEALYLAPLKNRFKTNQGQIHRGMVGFMLLIDIKADAETVWPVLRTSLNQYRELFTQFTDSSTTTGAVTVVLSGARPVQQVQAEPLRLCGIDGRLSDLDSNPSPHLYPLVSDSWRPTFGGFDEDQLAETDRVKLRAYVAKAHAQGRRIRFWGVPDQLYAWKELHAAGVDWLNTDKLPALAEFLRSQPASAPPQ
jgi:glycerophosphoryl diester phosphodiesterase